MAVNLMTLMGVGSSAAAAPPPSFTGVGDITAFDAYYSVARAYSAAYAAANGKFATLKDTVTTHTCDILAASTGGPGVTANCSSGADNGKTIAAWTSNPITVIDLFNQATIGTNDFIAIGQPPSLVLLAGNYAMQFAGTQFAGTSFTGTLAQPTSVLAVAETTGSGYQSVYSTLSGSGLQAGFDTPTQNTAILHCGTLLSVACSDSAMHAIQFVANGASSSIKVDGGSITTGNAGTDANQNNLVIGANSGPTSNMTGFVYEAGHAAATAWSSGTQASLHTNCSAFYGTP